MSDDEVGRVPVVLRGGRHGGQVIRQPEALLEIGAQVVFDRERPQLTYDVTDELVALSDGSSARVAVLREHA